MEGSSIAHGLVRNQRMLHFLTFELSESACALPLESVQETFHIPALSRPPGIPRVLEGFLNLRGTAVPVIRLDRLFGLPETGLGPYTTLILLRQTNGPLALLVDRARDVLAVSEKDLLPVQEGHTFNDCARAQIPQDGLVFHLLGPGRILLEKEQQLIRELQAAEQNRIDQLGIGNR